MLHQMVNVNTLWEIWAGQKKKNKFLVVSNGYIKLKKMFLVNIWGVMVFSRRTLRLHRS